MNNFLFCEALFRQHQQIGRSLPWRHVRDPYPVWLSEILLQQTTVRQAIPYYLKFLERFPDLASLAAAPQEEVLRMWQGLGYYSRARNLSACAKELMSRFGGRFPETYEEWLSLPGVGPYTAAAVVSLVFGKAVPAIDANVARVVSRLMALKAPVGTPLFRRQATEWLKKRMPPEAPGKFNEALIDTGALVCLPREPLCDRCLLQPFCKSFQKGRQKEFPVKDRRPDKKCVWFHYAVFEWKGCIPLWQRPERGIWGGFYDLPCIEANKPLTLKELKAAFARTYGLEGKNWKRLGKSMETLTHRRVHCVFYSLELEKAGQHDLVDRKEALRSRPLTKSALRWAKGKNFGKFKSLPKFAF